MGGDRSEDGAGFWSVLWVFLLVAAILLDVRMTATETRQRDLELRIEEMTAKFLGPHGAEMRVEFLKAMLEYLESKESER